MACCNSIFVLQGLILRLHDVPNFRNDVPNNVFFVCVLGAIVEAMLITIVFFIQEIGDFCIFHIYVNFCNNITF